MWRARVLRAWSSLAVIVVSVAVPSSPASADAFDPAGGTPLEDLVPASIVAVIGVFGLTVLAVVYRRGGAGWLRDLAVFSERVSNIPRYAALPAAVGGGALLIAVFGFYWDVSTHIDNGRDAGPFANPSHYFILAAGIGLVAARILLGRGGALACVAFFLLVRGGLALLVAPVLDRSLLHIPLYIVEALLVEGAALLIRRDRQVTFGAVAGALIGTVGLAAEWGWSHLWMPLPWPAPLWPEGALLGLAAAVSGGVLGGLVGRVLAPAEVGREPVRWPVGAGAVVVAVVCLTYPSIDTDGPDVRAEVVLEDVGAEAGRTVHATVALDPPDAAEEALWFEVLAWQGREWSDGGLVRTGLDHGGAGVYRTVEPVPVHGEWKTVLRLHRDRSLQAMPIYLPDDPGIPAEEVPADPSFTRPFAADKSLLQREAVGGTPTLQAIGYLVLLLIAATWLAAMTWGLHRINRAITSETTAVRDHAVM